MEIKDPWDKYSIDITDRTGFGWHSRRQYWRNFIIYVQDLYPNIHWDETENAVLYPLIAEELKKFKAIRIDQETSFSRLVFDTESDMTYFLLRWS